MLVYIHLYSVLLELVVFKCTYNLFEAHQVEDMSVRMITGYTTRRDTSLGALNISV